MRKEKGLTKSQKKNFGYAGEILAKIWSSIIIDGHPVLAEFVSDLFKKKLRNLKNGRVNTFANHSIFLQIIKCKDSKCCSPFGLNYLNVVKDRFLPPPISVTRTTTSDIKRVKQDVDAHYLFVTQNLALEAQLGATTLQNFPKSISYVYSYSAAQNIMERRLCSKCGLYVASIKEVFSHEQMDKKQKTTTSDNPSEPPNKQSAETVQPLRLRPTCCSSATKTNTVCVPIPENKVDVA